MGLPFRDETETLLARNAELEGENARLRAQIDGARRQDAKARRPVRVVVAVAVGTAAIAVTAGALILGSRTDSAATATALAAPAPSAFPGIAVAPPPAAPPAPVVAADPTVPTVAREERPAAGDPLAGPPSTSLASRTQGLPFALAQSSDPVAWQKAREILEPTVYAKHATPAEVRLLEQICDKQGDRTCVATCKALEVSAGALSPAPQRNVFDLAVSEDPADRMKARQILEVRVFSKRGSPAEIRLLKQICRQQGDATCVDTCKSLESPVPPGPRPHL